MSASLGVIGMSWTDERITLLKGYAADGKSAAEIAVELGVSRSAVIGKLSRIKQAEAPKIEDPRKLKVRELLLKGDGYETIAAELNVGHDTITNVKNQMRLNEPDLIKNLMNFVQRKPREQRAPRGRPPEENFPVDIRVEGAKNSLMDIFKPGKPFDIEAFTNACAKLEGVLSVCHPYDKRPLAQREALGEKQQRTEDGKFVPRRDTDESINRNIPTGDLEDQMSIHTLKATVWEMSPEGATVKVFNPLPGTTVEKNIDIEDMRDSTLQNACGKVVYEAMLACIKDGKELIDPHLEIRISLGPTRTEVRSTKTY